MKNVVVKIVNVDDYKTDIEDASDAPFASIFLEKKEADREAYKETVGALLYGDK